MTVERVRLGSVLQLQREPIEVDAKREYQQIGVRGFGRGLISYPAVPATELSKLQYYRLDPNRLVVSNIKGWEGAVAVSGSTESGRVASSRFLTYAAVGPVDLRYVQHWLLSERGLDALGKASPGSADRNRTLSKLAFAQIEMPLPPLDEQRRIADHLDAVERVVTDTASRVDFVTSRWRALIEQLAGLRSTTESIELRQILRERRAQPVETEESYPISGVYSFGRGLLRRQTLRGDETKYATMTRLTTNDVVYSKLGAFEGAVAVVEDAHAGRFVSPEFPVFTVAESHDPEFLRYCFIASSFVEQLGDATTGVGARQKRVSPSAFLSLRIPVRPVEEQLMIAGLLNRATAALRLSERARELREALLPAARNEIFSAV